MLIPLFSEYRYMYPLEPEYEYVPTNITAIGPAKAEHSAATANNSINLPKLLPPVIVSIDRDKDITVSTFRENDVKGIAPRKLYKKFGFEEGELIEEFGYPNQRFVLHANKSAENVIIGTTVTVTVDRPLGSYHPKYKDMYYPVNYGYIEEIMAPDGEEQDAYILGVNEPVDKFTGKIIAIVYRKDDVEEKWVVVPDGMMVSKDEIRQQIYFQEQYYDSEIVM